MRLQLDVKFEKNEIDDMVEGLRGLIKRASEESLKSKQSTTIVIPLGRITVSLSSPVDILELD